jgi:phosphoribosylanthranilate isomerase
MTPPDRSFVLAGGLDPHNVARAVAAVHPWGVDASTGLESSPGIKDSARVAAFVEEAKRT